MAYAITLRYNEEESGERKLGDVCYRLMKPLGKVKIQWSPEFAYVIGLLTTDGNLSPDGRHINFTSKDRELVGKRAGTK